MNIKKYHIPRHSQQILHRTINSLNFPHYAQRQSHEETRHINID